MVVLDASAILAWLRQEPGSGRLRELLGEALVPATNWSEVLQKVRQMGRDAEATSALLDGMGVRAADVTEADGRLAARLWEPNRSFSLADRICVASGILRQVSVVTADRSWSEIPGGAKLVFIR